MNKHNQNDRVKTILIIDDTSENIHILSELFKDDYAVKAAVSGRQGLELAVNSLPDLILLDIVMPEQDGFEVCRKMKENPVLADIPVIFLTAKTDVSDKVRAFSGGGVDYITKPFEPEEVRARVHTHIELKRARELIRRYNTDLETMLVQRTKALIYSERQAAFGQLVQGVVHNLSSPLSGILGNQQYMQMLIQDLLARNDSGALSAPAAELCEELEKSLKMIGYSVNLMTQITQSLLAKSRTDKMDDIKCVDVNEIIRLDLDFLESDLRFKHNIEKEIRLSEERLEIDAAPAEIAQVFQNLVNNALDSLQNAKPRKMIIESGRRGTQVFFSVTDNGPGIPESIKSRIFDPFFTTKSAPETRRENNVHPVGTGLGLWSCQETVKSYGGKIEFESNPATGTRFTVYLPQISDGK